MTSTVDTSFIRPADRIAPFKNYFFADLGQRLAELRKRGVDVIRLDMGSPDLPPADFITDALIENAKKPNKHGYTPYGGTPEYHQAIVQYYKTRFDVDLVPQKETLALLGSKEGLFEMSQVLLNPGDISLIPDPGYPTYTAGAVVAQAEIYLMPLLKENNFLPDLSAIPEETARRAKLMWLNYPNNPTGAVAPLSFFEEVVAFGKKYEIVIAHDAPYADICFNDYVAPSILQVPGAMDVAVELNSLSKTYNMAGWRLGMAVGNPQIIKFLHTYKSQADTSHFGPIYDAGIAALTGDQAWIKDRNDIYRQRRDLIVDTLKQAGFTLDSPPAAIYVWAKLPQPFTDSTDFCNRLLEDTGVSTTPGVVYGKYGEGYLRIALSTATDRIEEAMRRLLDWVKVKA